MILLMTRIRIVGPKTLLGPIIDRLQQEGAVHIESRPADVKRIEEIPIVRRFTVQEVSRLTKETLDKLLEQVKRLLLMLPPGESGPDAVPSLIPLDVDDRSLKRLLDQIGPIAERVESLVTKRKIHADELSLLTRYEKVIQTLAPLIAKVEESLDLEYMGLVLQARERGVIPALQTAMARLTGDRYELFTSEVDEETLAGLLVFPKAGAAQVKTLLWEENIGELRLPASITDKPLNEAVRIILRKRIEIPEKIRRLDGELGRLSRRWSADLRALRQWLENRIEQILVSESFYETRMAFLIYGWIPQNRRPRLEERLMTEFGGRVLIEELPVEEEEKDRIPVALRNRPWIRPFEIFTRVLPLPRYGTIDPTPFIAAFFPLFFGIIIGDIGYGLILLAAAYFLRIRYRTNRFLSDVGCIFTWAASSSIVWGCLYGELFGDLGERLGLHPLLINRMEDFLTTLFFAVGVGVVHILLGIGLGVYTAVRRGRRREIIAKTTGMVLVAAFLVMLCGTLGWLPHPSTAVGLAIVLLSLPVLILGGGPSAAMEIHNLVNLLSYLRLMGIGVASVALAFAANTLGSLTGNLVLGILVAALLHAVNLVFGVFSPTIQSLRLHYVEFFENFFEGGGVEYRPFKRVT
jgi:V/A-type H+-transporting ATPase subunit I